MVYPATGKPRPMVATPAAAMKKIMKLSERPAYAKMLIYGEPGVGKTYLAAGAPKPILLITEFAVSDMTLFKAASDYGVDPDIYPIESVDDMDAAIEFLKSMKHEYQTVVLDSLTDLNSMVLSYMVDKGCARNPNHDADQPEIGDWFRVERRMNEYITALRNLPLHVIVTALEVSVEREQRILPALQPKKFQYTAPGKFNAVFRLCKTEDLKGNVRRTLYTDINAGTVMGFSTSKNPAGILPRTIENPRISEVIKMVEDGVKKMMTLPGAQADNDSEQAQALKV